MELEAEHVVVAKARVLFISAAGEAEEREGEDQIGSNVHVDSPERANSAPINLVWYKNVAGVWKRGRREWPAGDGPAGLGAGAKMGLQ